MQTSLASFIANTSEGREADAILRRCVHCGFCNATCPTYQLLGDERDGPRGRIYLIKQVLEGSEVSSRTRMHLDRCLTCRACETTCPSGVNFHRLADIGRPIVEARTRRPLLERLTRWALCRMLPYRGRFALAYRAARAVRGLLPARLRGSVAKPRPAPRWPEPHHGRRLILLDGCVQPVLAPGIHATAARVLDGLGMSLIRVPGSGCCGALSHHYGAPGQARQLIRRNVDAWWSELQAGAEAVISTASGCGAMLRDYGVLLRDEPDYAERAAHIAERSLDLSQVLTGENLQVAHSRVRRVAFHSPCTLQHALGLPGRVETWLSGLGFELTDVRDAHLCCGSAGAYSVLQPELAQALRDRKLGALAAGDPEMIVTANIGCMLHLQSGTELPVRHWIELFEG